MSNTHRNDGNLTVPGGSVLGNMAAQAMAQRQAMQSRNSSGSAPAAPRVVTTPTLPPPPAPLASFSASKSAVTRPKAKSTSLPTSSSSTSSRSVTSYQSSSYGGGYTSSSPYSSSSYSSGFSAEELATQKAEKEAREKAKADAKAARAEKQQERIKTIKTSLKEMRAFAQKAQFSKDVESEFSKRFGSKALALLKSNKKMQYSDLLKLMFGKYVDKSGTLDKIYNYNGMKQLHAIIEQNGVVSEAFLEQGINSLCYSHMKKDGVVDSAETITDNLLGIFNRVQFALTKAIALLNQSEVQSTMDALLVDFDFESLSLTQDLTLRNAIGEDAFDLLKSGDKEKAFSAMFAHYVKSGALGDSPFSENGLAALSALLVKHGKVDNVLFAEARKSLAFGSSRADGQNTDLSTVTVDLSDIFDGLNKALLGAIELLRSQAPKAGEGLKAQLPTDDVISTDDVSTDESVADSASSSVVASTSSTSAEIQERTEVTTTATTTSPVVSGAYVPSSATSSSFISQATCCKCLLPLVAVFLAAGAAYLQQMQQQDENA